MLKTWMLRCLAVTCMVAAVHSSSGAAPAEPTNRYRQVVSALGNVRWLAWSSDGRRLAYAGGYNVGLWDTERKTLSWSVPVRDQEGWLLAWSRDHRLMALGSDDGMIRILDARDGSVKRVLRAHGPDSGVNSLDTPGCLDWQPRTHLLAYGSRGYGVRIWNADRGTLIKSLLPHAQITSLAWRRDGKQLALATWDASLHLWDPETDQLEQLRAAPDEGGHRRDSLVAWSNDHRLAFGAEKDEGIGVWAPARKKLLFALKKRGLAFGYWTEWSPDGRYVANTYSPWAQVWDTRSESHELLSSGILTMRAMRWHPTTNLLAVADGGAIALRVPLQQAEVARLDLGKSQIDALDWSPRGNRLAVGTDDGRLLIWDAPVSTALPALKRRKGRAREVTAARAGLAANARAATTSAIRIPSATDPPSAREVPLPASVRRAIAAEPWADNALEAIHRAGASVAVVTGPNGRPITRYELALLALPASRTVFAEYLEDKRRLPADLRERMQPAGWDREGIPPAA